MMNFEDVEERDGQHSQHCGMTMSDSLAEIQASVYLGMYGRRRA
jgi:hypothetical protein